MTFSLIAIAFFTSSCVKDHNFPSSYSGIFFYLIMRIEGIKLEITYGGITLTPIM